MIKSWIKIFYRNSKKNSLNLIINILGLALGFAGLMFVLLYLNDEKSYNEWNPEKGKIHRVVHHMANGEVWSNSTKIEGPTYKEEIPEVTDYYLSGGWYFPALLNVDGKDEFTEDILIGAANFFDFFPFEIYEGNVNSFKEAKNHIAVSKKLSDRYFEGGAAVGKIVILGNKSYVITTVFVANEKSYFNPEMVIQYSKEQTSDWSSFSRSLFCKIDENASIEDVESKMDAIFTKKSFIPEAEKSNISLEEFKDKNGSNVKLERVVDIRLHTLADDAGPEGKGNYQLILIMLGLSVLLIVISCVNFINLSVSSASQRSKEIGVKKTIGLSKFTIGVQYILEIIFQGFISFVLSLVFVELLMPYFNNFMNKYIGLLDGYVLLDMSVIALLISMCIGLIPAIYLSNFKAVEVLKGNVSRSKRGGVIRNAMLGIQFLISGLFLIGAMVIYLQVDYMTSKNLGFSGDHVLLVNINGLGDRYKKYELLKEELVKHPDIDIITSNYYTPGSENSSTTIVTYKDVIYKTKSDIVDFEYIKLVKLKILKGRGFEEKFASDTISNIVINETLAKELGIYNDPIGKQVRLAYSSPDGIYNKTVIGMVKDYHVKGFDQNINPMFMCHWNTFEWAKKYDFSTVIFKIKPENMGETIKFIEDYWTANVDPGYPFSYRFLNKQFQATFIKYKKQKTLFSILTFIVVLVSLLGLFALATLNIQQRLNEVAIRKTLGASTKEIMCQLIKGFIKIVLIVGSAEKVFI
ncbi:MAG: ABC transporter permease [Flavobacteriaceae bacterium]|nr:ABC transporter permease [Flavobacteriaceae bacterium]